MTIFLSLLAILIVGHLVELLRKQNERRARFGAPFVANGDKANHRIPPELGRYVTEIVDVSDKISWVEAVVLETSQRASWIAARASDHRGLEFHFSTDRGSVTFVASESSGTFYMELGTTIVEHPEAKILEEFLYTKLNDAGIIFRVRLPKEAFDHVKNRLLWIHDEVSRASKRLSATQEERYVSSLGEADRTKYLAKREQEARYCRLVDKKLKGELTEPEAREFLEINRVRNLEEKARRQREAEERKSAEEKTIQFEAEKRKALEEKLAIVAVSDLRTDYVIGNDDYKRGSDKEREYLVKHKATLFRVFDNRCANCGDDENGLDVDHFIFSKNEGGVFAMLSVEGHYVNNAIPLCEFCNRSKSDRSYKVFFSKEKLLEILTKSAVLSARLNGVSASSKKAGEK